jgi:diaminopimelate decarboxylase
MYLHGTGKINPEGHLEIGGRDTVQLAQEFGTPLYVFDEALVRQRAREYVAAFKASGFPFQVAYASKAFSTKAMVALAAQEGLSLDVVSDGELYTALEAGFPAEKIHFHGNNKTIDEINMGLDAGIGCFVVDNYGELELLNALAADKGKIATILIRVTPGVEAHTHEAITTGQEDSKFGVDLQNGTAYKAVEKALSLANLKLIGLHSHIGSQIFEVDGFVMAAARVAAFAVQVRDELGALLQVINLGGGFGIRYVDGDKPLAIATYVAAICDAVRSEFTAAGYPLPAIWVEPGRSIVGDAGTTLYTIGSSKDIPGVRKYIAVDGGMTDNPRPALYGSLYEAVNASHMRAPLAETVTIAGKCCESGDKLIIDAQLPVTSRGDILAIYSTGAYNYSMASNYNRIRRPAVVFVQDGQADVVVRRETLEDITHNDLIPARLAAKTTVLSS